MRIATICKSLCLSIVFSLLFSSCKPPQNPADTDGKFTIAIIPDTQQEVVIQNAIEKEHFINRTQWLADNREDLDLRFTIHTGDVVNWGNEDESQLKLAADAMNILTEAKIPTALCLGNHDTAAVGVGGSAADPANTRERVRDTTAFNKYFPASDYKGLTTFEKDKIDNAYQCFEAAGCKWLVLSLELWPRTEVMSWACEVIESHPEHNVIVATHSYLNADGSIYHDCDYGHNSPQTLFERVICQYENVKFVFSGHTGDATHRIDYGIHNNQIASFLGCFHSNDRNPVQLLEIDTVEGSASIRTYSPIDNQEWTQFGAVIQDMDYIKEAK